MPRAVVVAAAIALAIAAAWFFVVRRSTPAGGSVDDTPAAPSPPGLAARSPPRDLLAPGSAERDPAGDGTSVGAAQSPNATRWTLSGTVLSSVTKRGFPGASVKLELSRGAHRDVLATLRCDEQGRFSTDLPALDRMSPAARRLAILWATATAPGHFLYYQRSNLGQDLGTSPRHLDATLTLVPGSMARGRVVTADGRVVPGAGVSIYGDGEGDNFPRSTSAGDDGRFEVGVPWEGAGFVTAGATGVGSATIREVRWTTASDVELPDLVLRGDGTLGGSVVREDGTPLGDARVWCVATKPTRGGARAQLEAPPGLEGGQTSTDDQGRFRFAGLRAGTYRISAVVYPDDPHATVVTAATGAEGVRVVVTGRLLRVRVVEADGAPFVGAGVQWFLHPVRRGSTAQGTVHSGTSGAEEKFLVPSATRIVVAARWGGPVVERQVDVPSLSDPPPLVIGIGREQPAGLVDLVFEGPGSEDVRSALLSFSNPVYEYAVEGAPDAWARGADPLLVPSGEHRLEVVPLLGHGTADETRTMWLGRSLLLSVAPGETMTVRVQARIGGRVRFRFEAPNTKSDLDVESATATREDGAIVEIGEWAHQTGARLHWGDASFPAGAPAWPLRPIETGRWRYRLKLRGYAAVETVALVEEGKFTDSTIRLEPE